MSDVYKKTIERIIKYKHEGVIVGGFALEFYLERYGEPVSSDSPVSTSDLDFLGSRAAAQQLADLLQFQFPLKISIDNQDVASPNNAVIAIEVEGEDKPLIVDFLAFLKGFGHQEVEKRAAHFKVEHGGGYYELDVMHPLDVLISRVVNVSQLKSKQNDHGIAQVNAAIRMIQMYFENLEKAGNQELIDSSIVEVDELASGEDGAMVLSQYKIDVSSAVPSRFRCAK